MAKKEDTQYYLGNKNLPRGSEEFEWTPQIVNNLNRLRKRYRVFKNEWEKGNI